MIWKIATAAIAASAVLAAGSASAAVVQFSGYDSGASAPGTNATAAQAAFLTATGSLSVIDFEDSALPTGVTRSGGTRVSNPTGLAQFWGDNTTPGGDWHVEFGGGTPVVFTFATPIDSFGLFLGGLQFANTIRWTNSQGAQSVSIAGSPGDGGFSFLGFTDIGESITSISVASPSDFNGLDDVVYGVAAAGGVPEPATWGLMIGGFGLIGAAHRRRRTMVSA